MSADPARWVLTGGEDHGLLACFPDEDSVAAAGGGWRVVGRVTAAAAAGVTVDGGRFTGEPGHRHFS